MFDPADLKGAEGLMLAASELVAGLYAGQHPSTAHGPGVEFHDYRPYTAGDDPKTIDWRAYGRTDRFYIRRREHDSELAVMLCLDSSRSMDWPPGPSHARSAPQPTRSAHSDAQPASPEPAPHHKLTHAGRLAAALAMLVTRQGDPVGLAAGAGELDTWLDFGAGPEHLRQLVHQLHAASQPTTGAEWARPGGSSTPPDPTEGNQPQGHDRSASLSLAALLAALPPRLNRRSLVVVLSDWLDPPDHTLEAAGRLTAAGHELLAVQLLAPGELRFQPEAALPERRPPKLLSRLLRPAAITRLIDPETAASAAANPTVSAPKYHRALQRHLQTLRQQLHRPGSRYVLLRSDDPPAANLRRLLSSSS
jgi:uncharacterized protein (DUF58 family)